VGTTALTAAQLLATVTFNNLAKAYCLHYAGSLQYVDTYAATVDNTVLTGIPRANMLADLVHPTMLGADAIALAAVAPLLRLVPEGQHKQIGETGNNNLISSFGYMTGGSTAESGTTGNTGNYPAGWAGSERSIGSAATVVSSIVNLPDGARAWQVAIASTNTSEVIDCRGPNSTLAALGLAVGDRIHAEIEIIGESVNKVNPNLFLLMPGSTSRYADGNFVANGASNVTYTYTPTDADSGKMVTPEFVIPDGTTNVRFFIRFQCGASSSATFKMSRAAIVKH
jgi:hypothetical protein